MDDQIGKKLGAEFIGTFLLVFGGCGSAIFAAARRSSMRPLVQEPMKTRSSLMSVILVPALSPM